MIDPIYTTTLVVGGSTHKYAFTALPTELLAEQSLNLSITITNADGTPFDLSSATAEFFCTARNVIGLAPTNLGSATLSDSGSGTTDTVSIVVPKNGIPDFLGSYSPTRTGSSVFYFQIQDADSYIQIYQYVNVTAGDFSGDGSVDVVDLPAPNIAYDPTDPTDWVDPDPISVGEGLDQLADRVTTIETSPSGDMLASTYDPTNIASDVYDRANHTGTQLASTISDFDTNLAGTANVTAFTPSADYHPATKKYVDDNGGGGVAPRYNYIINPRMNINQRSFAGGALGLDTYGYDRWKSADASTNITELNGTITLTAGVVKQIIETPQVVNGKTFTASLENATGDYVLYILDNAGVEMASSTSSKVSHAFTSEEATVSVQISHTSGTVTFDSVKFETGSTATDHIDRLTGEELALCQRYYHEHDYKIGFNPSNNTGSGSASRHVNWVFPVEMRVAPSMVFVYNSNVATSGVTPETTGFYGTGTTTTTGGIGRIESYTADAEL